METHGTLEVPETNKIHNAPPQSYENCEQLLEEGVCSICQATYSCLASSSVMGFSGLQPCMW